MLDAWARNLESVAQQEKTNESMQQGRDDEKLQQTVQLTKQRLAMFAKVLHIIISVILRSLYKQEYRLLQYSVSSARIFFRADLTAAEEDKQKEAEGTISSYLILSITLL